MITYSDIIFEHVLKLRKDVRLSSRHCNNVPQTISGTFLNMLYANLFLLEVYSTTMRGILSLPCLPPRVCGVMRGEVLKVPIFSSTLFLQNLQHRSFRG
jgi:hypothetical protein